MRVYIDACIEPRVREAFQGHDVRTAFDLGWHRLKDHALIPLLQEQFDVPVTLDRGFEHHHDLKSLHFGIVIVHVRRNKVSFYRPLFGRLLAAVESVRAGEVVHVSEL